MFYEFNIISFVFRPIKPKRVADEIVEQVEGLIRSGDLKPGDKLPSERELAESFQVSRASLREAINRLESKGLIVSIQGEGTFVRAITEKTFENPLNDLLSKDPNLLWELMEVRKILETWCVLRSVDMATDDDLKALNDSFSQMEKDYLSNSTGEKADAMFHLAIIASAHNTILYHIMTSIFNLLTGAIKITREYVITEGGLSREELLNQHRKIRDAIIKREREVAKKALEEHLIFINDNFKKFLAENREK